MKIRLKEIPADGRSYTFSRETGEFNEALADLIQDHPYDVAFEIKPLGNAYELRGKVATTLSEICSKCGWDFELAVDRKFHEVLFEEQEEHRKSQSVHGNQSVDFLNNGPSMTLVPGEVFDAADYTHEIIALAEPFYPTCGENGTCLHEDEVKSIRQKLESEFAAADVPEVKSPFAVLKNLELKN